ncbi:MAG: methionyl-tRNA formyltransferase [Treponema sp.]|nr:methionyl-tRNA formyltransferase [Treponema sp.]
MKILYAGSPDAAVITLKHLLENQTKYGFEIAGVLSNPPTAKGRHKELTPTPVAAFALENNLPVFTPEHLDAECRAAIEPLKADLLVCFAYGHIFGPKFMAMFPMGGINLHPSLLPKYRGCTPVPAAILNRDKKTAATIQTLSAKMDEGFILAQKIVDLDGTETNESLLNNCAEIGADLICQVIQKAAENNHLPEGTEQQGEASYTQIITKEDGKINWTQSAAVTEAKIRAYYPDPGCWCIEKEMPLRILKAGFISAEDDRCTKYQDAENGTVLEFIKSEGILVKTGSGILVLKELQRQGKKAMNYKDFMNGARDFPGTILK